MAKRDRSSVGATEEERNERKRLKKEAKKRKKLQKAKGQQDASTSSSSQSNTFFRKRLVLAMSLLPNSLGDVVKRIEDSLRDFLLKYSDGFGGVLLSFENVKTLGQGSILNELPHIHYDVEVDALVFRPTIGCNLSGLVTEASFHSHLSLVVHRYFNASISAEEMRKAGFDFDSGLEQWCWQDGEEMIPISKDDSISFVCQKIHESGGIISLAGEKPSKTNV